MEAVLHAEVKAGSVTLFGLVLVKRSVLQAIAYTTKKVAYSHGMNSKLAVQ
jgi:hypothetical protein